jgi:hypothetical protein
LLVFLTQRLRAKAKRKAMVRPGDPVNLVPHQPCKHENTKEGNDSREEIREGATFSLQTSEGHLSAQS